jgi:hypothetical protein
MATGILPNTGQAIAMGQVYTAFSGLGHPAASNIKLSATLGVNYGGKAANTQTSFSSTFGGKVTPNSYPN